MNDDQLLTITETAELLRAPSPPCAGGATPDRGRAASRSAAESPIAAAT
jgi:hypothetical protein